jgi:hypothetical protein
MSPLDNLCVLLDVCPESWKHGIILVGGHSTSTLEILQKLLLVNSTVEMTERFLTAVVAGWADIIQVTHGISFFFFLILNGIFEGCKSTGFHDYARAWSHEIGFSTLGPGSAIQTHLEQLASH